MSGASGSISDPYRSKNMHEPSADWRIPVMEAFDEELATAVVEVAVLTEDSFSESGDITEHDARDESRPTSICSAGDPELDACAQDELEEKALLVTAGDDGPNSDDGDTRNETGGTRWSPMTIAFKNLAYSVPKTKSRIPDAFGMCRSASSNSEDVEQGKEPCRKVILEPFSGIIRPGELLAVMGPSGSGKSSFLQVLASKLANENASGQISVNGLPVTRDIARNCFGYVWQDDALQENMTVRETLRFVHRLRFKLDAKLEEQKVQQILDELGLNSCAETLVGGTQFRGISGGERKRLSIALELVGDPSVLFLDEPTTGLDSCTSLQIVRTLKTLASRNRTVVCSIHQPQSEIFHQFDKLLLFGMGGKLVYHGPGSEAALAYFDYIQLPCDRFTNPTDHFLDIVNSNFVKNGDNDALDGVSSKFSAFFESLTLAGRLEYLRDSFKASDTFAKTAKELLTDTFSGSRKIPPRHSSILSSDLAPCKVSNTLVASSKSVFASRLSRIRAWSLSSSSGFFPLANLGSTIRPSSLLQKFFTLLQRQALECRRNKTATMFRILQSLLIAVFLGLTFLNVGGKSDQKAAEDRRAVIFFVALQQTFLGCLTVMSLFHGPDRRVFVREYSASLYSSFAYFSSKILAELPFQLASPLIFSVIVYTMLQLSPTILQFSIFLLAQFVGTMTGQALGLAISMWTPSLMAANIVGPIIIGLIMLSGGYFIAAPHVPAWLQWTVTANFVKYINEILAVNDLTGLKFTCHGLAAESVSSFPPSSLPHSPVFNESLIPQELRVSAVDNTLGSFLNPFSNSTLMFGAAKVEDSETVCLYRTGQDLLSAMSISNVDISRNFSILIWTSVGLLILAFLGLHFNVARRR